MPAATPALTVEKMHKSFGRLEVLTRLLVDGLHEIMNKHGVAHYSTHAGSMFSQFKASRMLKTPPPMSLRRM